MLLSRVGEHHAKGKAQEKPGPEKRKIYI